MCLIMFVFWKILALSVREDAVKHNPHVHLSTKAAFTSLMCWPLHGNVVVADIRASLFMHGTANAYRDVAPCLCLFALGSRLYE